MDTYMEMTAYGRKSEEAVEASAKEIERLDELLSTGSESSEITILNHNKTGKVSEDTAYLLKRSLELWKTTGGAFDITIYPVMRAWGFAGGEFQVPDNAELTGLLADVDASKIEFNENTLYQYASNQDPNDPDNKTKNIPVTYAESTYNANDKKFEDAEYFYIKTSDLDETVKNMQKFLTSEHMGESRDIIAQELGFVDANGKALSATDIVAKFSEDDIKNFL